ncbi:uncharacterized protein [Ptychodera flava]|uniref:uncharacterized protein n=1 Tax=Ptychodera flava TaxID=63121 RepID=UPI003969ED1E
MDKVILLSLAVCTGIANGCVMEQVEAQVGQSIALKCEVNVSSETMARWSRDDFQVTDNGGSVTTEYKLTGNHSLGQYYLLIENVQWIDDAVFKCNNADSTPQLRACIKVTVTDPPTSTDSFSVGVRTLPLKTVTFVLPFALMLINMW